MKWKRLDYIMKNRSSRNLPKRAIAKIYNFFLQHACRREELRLEKRYPHLTSPKYSAKDIMQIAAKRING